MKKAIIFITTLFSVGITFGQTYQWAFDVGSNGYAVVGNAIILDNDGNLFVTGMMYGTADFDPSINIASITANGFYDAFVAKYDSAGNYLWAFNIGGSDRDYGYSIATDNIGNVYVTGYFMDTVDFDPSSNTANLVSHGSEDIFLAKYDAMGHYIWAIDLGGTYNDEGFRIAVDTAGNDDIYITGYFTDTVDFDPSINISTLVSEGISDVFVAKYDSAGHYQWAFNISGSGQDYGYSITLDAFGKVLVCGVFQNEADFDPSADSASLNSFGGGDVFVAKYDTAGNYIWAIHCGGPSSDIAYDLVTDHTGNVDVIGYFKNTADFDPSTNVANLVSHGNYDVFVTKFDSAGNYIWAFNIGGTNIDCGYGIATDNIGNIVVTGRFRNKVDFDPSANIAKFYSNGSDDIFIARYDTLGQYLGAFSIGATYFDYGMGITLDKDASIYVSGLHEGTADFDPSDTIVNLIPVGTIDMFVAKYDTTCFDVVATASEDTSICLGDAAHLTAYGGTNYLWMPATGLNDSMIANPLASPTASTVYTVVVSNSCYSDMAFVSVNVIIVDTSVTNNGVSLTSNATGAFYKWYDCLNESLIIDEIWQSYSPTATGSYAVIVWENGCSDTSNCHNFTVGMKEITNSTTLTLRPNPASSKFRIHNAKSKIETVDIYDISGRRVKQLGWQDTAGSIGVDELRSGLYIVKIMSTGGLITRKLVVE